MIFHSCVHVYPGVIGFWGWPLAPNFQTNRASGDLLRLRFLTSKTLGSRAVNSVEPWCNIFTEMVGSIFMGVQYTMDSFNNIHPLNIQYWYIKFIHFNPQKWWVPTFDDFFED